MIPSMDFTHTDKSRLPSKLKAKTCCSVNARSTKVCEKSSAILSVSNGSGVALKIAIKDILKKKFKTKGTTFCCAGKNKSVNSILAAVFFFRMSSYSKFLPVSPHYWTQPILTGCQIIQFCYTALKTI